MSKGLEKAMIIIREENGHWNVERPIPVLFNPSEYTQRKSAKYKEEPSIKSTNTLQLTGSELETLEMDLFFDTYESNENVRDYTDKITDLIDYDQSENDQSRRPARILKFVWGGINFTCVLESATRRFTMFNKDGVPVRATLTVTFKEYPLKNVSTEDSSSNSNGRVVTLKTGDSFWAIAANAYGSPSMWRSIAEKNNIANPRILVPGKEIVIPSRSESRTNRADIC